MTKKSYYLFLVVFIFVFTNCKRTPLHTEPKITHLSDFESNDGVVHLNIQNGKAPYQINWSNQETDSVLENLAAGTYFVTVTDARKKQFIDTIMVNQPVWPVCVDVEQNSYKTAVIADQIWMIENLRVTVDPNNNPIESVLVESSDSVPVNYGRLYTWKTAMTDSVEAGVQGICPDGWHLPTDEEWTQLIDNISSFDQEIPNLKQNLELTYPGFYSNQLFNKDLSVSYWTSSQAGDNAWKIYFNKNLSKAFRYHEVKSHAISVRCIKD